VTSPIGAIIMNKLTPEAAVKHQFIPSAGRVFVPRKPFKSSLMFVGSWPHPQTLHSAGKACQGQTL